MMIQMVRQELLILFLTASIVLVAVLPLFGRKNLNVTTRVIACLRLNRILPAREAIWKHPGTDYGC